MERRVNYILVGAFSLLVVASFVTFVLWSHYRGDGKHFAYYTVFFDQAVNGLALGGSVRYLGVEAGRVESIGLDISQPLPRVRVTVGINDAIPVTDGTVATLKPSGITGVSFVDLRADPAHNTPLSHKDNELPVIRSESSGFDRLFDGAAGSMQHLDILLTDLDHLSNRIDGLLAKNEASIDRLLGPGLVELEETIRAGHKAMDAIASLSKSLDENPSQLLYPTTPQGVKIAP